MITAFKNFDRAEYFRTLRFCLYTMRRPLDGFWDLTREKRGSLAAAHTIIFFAVIITIMRLTLSNFQFINVNMEYFNAWGVVLGVLLPIGLWTVANWALTTLFDGKGRMADIYMGTAYALAPMVIIDAALIPISHFITYEEGAVYWMFSNIGFYWFIFLLLCAMKEIHEYSVGKAILTSIFTVFAIGVMVFIFIMFFAVVSDGVVFFFSIGQEAFVRFLTG